MVEQPPSSKSPILAIQELPKNKRREFLEEFKTSWFRGKEIFSDSFAMLEKEIRSHPDTPTEELREQITQLLSKQDLNEVQKNALLRSTDLLCGQKKRAEMFFSKWKDADPARILKELTGLQLDKIKRFQIKKGLITVDIETDSITANKIFNDDPELFDSSSRSGFYKESHGGTSAVPYIVIPEKYAENENNYKHEEQHAFNKVFQSVFEKIISDEEKKTMWKTYSSIPDDDEKKITAFQHGIDLELSDALMRAKDEIFAFSHNADPDVALRQLLNNEDYNYLREAEEKTFSDGTMKEERKEYFDIARQKYSEAVTRGFQSFEKLKTEFPNSSPISFLADQPITSWPSYTKKLIRAKNKPNKAER